jgi:hypothetical protein
VIGEVHLVKLIITYDLLLNIYNFTHYNNIMTRLFIIILFLTIAISPVSSQSTDLIVIDLVSPQEEIIPMSRFFNNTVEYVLLDVNEFYTMQKRSTYYLTSQSIIGVNGFYNAYLFDRQTGRFIKQISKEGTEENEYRRFPIARYGFDEKNNTLFFHDINQWKGFDTQGNKKVTKVTMPQYSNPGLTLPKESGGSIQNINDNYQNTNKDWLKGPIHNPYPFGKDTYIGYVNNTTGDINVKLVIFDKQGQVLKSFPNHQKYVKRTQENPFNIGLFYNYHNTVYFMETYGDTLFAVHSNRMKPHIIFNMGDKKIHYEEAVENTTFTYGRYNINLVKETDWYVFFKYTILFHHVDKYIYVNGYYDKKLKKTYVCKIQNGKAGFINDIDGLPDFNPLLITNKDEFLGVILPEDLSSNNTNTISKRGVDIVSQATTKNAPIIVIAHLK